ncbi:MAG: pyridoxamine 5'-phosphate oxidase family protein [Christensenellaceae bacterium]
MNEMRLKSRETSKEFALELLTNCEYAFIATSTEHQPYCVPISPVVIEGDVYFHCALAGYKLSNLLKNPQVCITCVGSTMLLPDAYTTQYESAVAFGSAQLIEDQKQKIFVLKELCKKFAASRLDRFDEAINQYLAHTAVVKIKISHITGKQNQPQKKE